MVDFHESNIEWIKHNQQDYLFQIVIRMEKED